MRCDAQEEVDTYWTRLLAGGSESRWWVAFKFGLSWQIVPARLPDLVKHPKAMEAMAQMRELDIAELERECVINARRREPQLPGHDKKRFEGFTRTSSVSS